MDKFLEKKKSMIKVIKNYGIKDKNVLKAMLKIPRHLFVPKQLENYSYEDMPLQIGNNQTISQPYTIAFMLQELGLKKKEKVLEIGTGSGYSAALISEITKTRVYTTEIISGLALKAEQNLIKAKVKKNKLWKPWRECDFSILFEYGIDDIGSNIDFLKENKICVDSGGTRFEWEGKRYSREDFIQFIGENNKEEEIKDLVKQTWDKLEEEAKVFRKAKYLTEET